MHSPLGDAGDAHRDGGMVTDVFVVHEGWELQRGGDIKLEFFVGVDVGVYAVNPRGRGSGEVGVHPDGGEASVVRLVHLRKEAELLIPGRGQRVQGTTVMIAREVVMSILWVQNKVEIASDNEPFVVLVVCEILNRRNGATGFLKWEVRVEVNIDNVEVMEIGKEMNRVKTTLDVVEVDGVREVAFGEFLGNEDKAASSCGAVGVIGRIEIEVFLECVQKDVGFDLIVMSLLDHDDVVVGRELGDEVDAGLVVRDIASEESSGVPSRDAERTLEG